MISVFLCPIDITYMAYKTSFSFQKVADVKSIVEDCVKFSPKTQLQFFWLAYLVWMTLLINF